MPETEDADEQQRRLAVFAATYGLSKQEITVLEMLAQQRSTEAIAKILGVTDNTIYTYVRRIRQKTGTSNRDELIAFFASQIPASPAAEDTDAPSPRPNSP